MDNTLLLAFAAPILAGAGVLAWKLLGRLMRFVGRRLVIEPLQTGIHEIIDREVSPKFDEIRAEQRAVHERIDSHMASEEGSFEQFTDSIKALKEQLDDPGPLLNEVRDTMKETQGVLQTHMAADERQFEHSSAALVTGQQQLLQHLGSMDDRLRAIERSIDKKS